MSIYLIVYLVIVLLIIAMLSVYAEDLRDLTVGELLLTAGGILVPGINAVLAVIIFLAIVDESGILEKKPFARKVHNDSTTV